MSDLCKPLLRPAAVSESPADVGRDFGMPADDSVLIRFGQVLPPQHMGIALDCIRQTKAADLVPRNLTSSDMAAFPPTFQAHRSAR